MNWLTSHFLLILAYYLTLQSAFFSGLKIPPPICNFSLTTCPASFRDSFYALQTDRVIEKAALYKLGIHRKLTNILSCLHIGQECN